MGDQGEQGAWQSRVEESLGQLWKGTLREVHTTLGRRRGGSTMAQGRSSNS